MARPKKTGHKSHDLVMEQDYKAKVGHNSGEVNPEIQEFFERHEKLEADIKALRADQKEIRNTIKTEFGIPIVVVTRELAERKLDENVRVEREAAAKDLKIMLGYQLALDLMPREPKDESNDPIEAAKRKVTNISSSKNSKIMKGESISFKDDEDSVA